jgi:HK97 family phage portal protein
LIVAYGVSQGALVRVHRQSYQAPTSIRLTEDYTADYAKIYATQPEVRVVVDFLARNVSQLALQSFRRKADDDRERLASTHPLAALLRRPNPYTSARRMIRDTIADRGIYDRVLWLKTDDGDGNRALVRMPPELWTVKTKSWLWPTKFELKGSDSIVEVDAADAVYFRGYNPKDPRVGLSPIESLRRTLAEEYAAGIHREQVLRNGARFSGYISRPANAPDWSPTARATFKSGWRSQFQGFSATEAGGTPVLEDGMEFIPAAQTAEQLQYVEARKLTREEVAAAYYIPPPMIGILDKATFSNITEQHKMLYQDTLGPILAEFQDELDLQLIPDFDTTGSIYVEFNMLEKLRGSFEEQVSQLQTATGAPFLTRAEARSRMNLPYIDGTDELVVPLNVLVGGQASPTDQVAAGSGGGDVEDIVDAELVDDDAKGARRPGIKSRPSTTHVTKTEQVLSAFFTRQAAAVLPRLGAKAASWWDSKRWDTELTGVLYALSATLTPAIAADALRDAGLDPDAYNVDQTLAYLAALSKAQAGRINDTTYAELSSAVSGSDDPTGAARDVFAKATDSRAAQLATTTATAYAGFATTEAAKQAAGSQATKTWVVTSGNPRSSHASMDGETVGIDEKFSNGADWPGDVGALGPDETAGCMCDVVISFTKGGA